MDLDAFTQVHEPEWQELQQLSSSRNLTGEQADRLVLLYQRANTHLSIVRSTSADPALVSRLSLLLLRGRTRLTGGKEPFLAELRRFFVVSFPAALWRLRWWFFWVSAVFFAVVVWAGFWLAGSEQLQAALLSDSQIKQMVEHDFVDYYSENPHASFAAQVWTNNAWIAAQCVAFGVFGIYVPFVLWQNAFNLGLVAGLMIDHGQGTVFFAYILPHGLLEITAVLIAGAAGIKLFWAWVAPGPLSRAESLAREGRSLFTVALGLVVVLFVSGLLEGFITPSPLPAWLRLVIGFGVWAAFLGYAAGFGRTAHRAGEIGDLREDQIGSSAPVSG